MYEGDIPGNEFSGHDVVTILAVGQHPCAPWGKMQTNYVFVQAGGKLKKRFTKIRKSS